MRHQSRNDAQYCESDCVPSLPPETGQMRLRNTPEKSTVFVILWSSGIA